MITLNGLHPKGLKNAFLWSRRQTIESLDGIIKADTLTQYLADESSKRYIEPPITAKIACYAAYQALIATGEVPLNEKAIQQYLVKT